MLALISPVLVQAYLARDARDLYTDLVKELPVTDWQQVDSAPAIDRSLAPMRPYVKCCGLKEGRWAAAMQVMRMGAFVTTACTLTHSIPCSHPHLVCHACHICLTCRRSCLTPLMLHRNMIEFDKDCGWDNWRSPNYTSPLMPLYVASGGNQSASSDNSTDSPFRRAQSLEGSALF